MNTAKYFVKVTQLASQAKDSLAVQPTLTALAASDGTALIGRFIRCFSSVCGLLSSDVGLGFAPIPEINTLPSR